MAGSDSALKSPITFGLSGGLASSQVETIHRAVLGILDETGLECKHPRTVDAATAEAGIRFENGRLKFSPDFVESTIDRVRAIGRRHRPAERLSLSGPFTAFSIEDMDTGEVRPTRAADLIPMLKLVATYNDHGPAPVFPWDLDDRIQILWLEKTCLEFAPGLGGSLVSNSRETDRWLGELHAAVGRRYGLVQQFIISPLRLDHIALEELWHYRDDPLIDCYPSLCPMPVGGTTAPLFAPGLLAQGIAESLGGLIVAHRLGFVGDDTLPTLRVDYGDMRHMILAYSIPENVMIQVLLRDLSLHFCGRPMEGLYLNTNAKRADPLATLDRMAYMLMLGLAGYRRFFLGAGLLSMDEVFSPAQFVIDMEICRYVQGVLDGMLWLDDAESIVQAVAEGVAEGNFLTHPSTLEALHTVFDSKLFRRDSVAQWRASGAPKVEQLAVTEARALIDAYHFELDTDKQNRLDSVFTEACRALGVDPDSQPLPRR